MFGGLRQHLRVRANVDELHHQLEVLADLLVDALAHHQVDGAGRTQRTPRLQVERAELVQAAAELVGEEPGRDRVTAGGELLGLDQTGVDVPGRQPARRIRRQLAV